MKNGILIVDFGTSNVRAIIFAADNGDVLASCSRKYTTLSPRPTFLELNPEEVWSLSEECVRNVMTAVDGTVTIRALNFSFIGASLFPLDENLKPTYNCILCYDPRAVAIAKEMARLFQSPTFRFSTWAPAAKIIWLKNNEPKVFAKTRHFWSIQQYILLRLGMEPVWDPTMANLHYMYDQNIGDWSQKIFDYVGIPREMVATKMMISDEIVGNVECYGDVALNGSVPVGIGAHDGDLGMLGLGLLGESGDVIAEVSGTFDHIGFIADIDPERPVTIRWKPGPLKNTIVLMFGFPTYGAVVEWFVNTFYNGDAETAYADLWSHCVFDGTPSDLLINPFFSGKGMIANLNLTVTKYDLFKALIEALTFETRRSAEAVLESKPSGCSRIRIGGGPAKSDEWTQLRATITGKTIERVASNDTSALGAAVLATLGSGFYKDLSEAVGHMIQIKDAFQPDAALQEVYEKRYQEYCAAVPREVQ